MHPVLFFSCPFQCTGWIESGEAGHKRSLEAQHHARSAGQLLVGFVESVVTMMAWTSFLLTGLQVTACLGLSGYSGRSRSGKDWLIRFESSRSRPQNETVPLGQFHPSGFGGNSRLQETVGKLDERAGPSAKVSVVVSVAPEGTVQILPSASSPNNINNNTGFLVTTLETSGRVSTQPILATSIPKPTSLLATAAVLPTAYPSTSLPPINTMVVDNIFATPVATGPPPATIAQRKDHPVPRLGITATPPISTNKFYANFFLGSQTAPTYLHPYSVAWSAGKGASASWGLAISHINPAQRVFGPKDATGAASYFINPVGIQSVVLSAAELGPKTVLTTDALTDMSARLSLRPSAEALPTIQCPLVQGAAFITALYNGSHPWIQTGVFFNTVTKSKTNPKSGVTKYKLLLEDGMTWLVYAYSTKGCPLDLQVTNNGLAKSKEPFYGIIQVAKDPGNGEAMYDAACGAYPVGVALSGSVNGKAGTYSYSYYKGGITSTTLAMFALPHHQASFDKATKSKVKAVQLSTTTKGVANLVVSDSWTMVEPNLPIDVGFYPWKAEGGSITGLSSATKSFIHNIALQEVSQNMGQQSNQNSMYFSGKALAKFASIVLTISDILGDKSLAASGLTELKAAFDRFVQNKQQYPLVYESAWGGVVSTATYVTGNAGDDFGNTYYNDHHFHYGYFIFAAAVIGHLDPTWTAANKDYVNTLVRDIANPSSRDPFFPVSRSFDWFHGHSWAHGLFETLDGKVGGPISVP